MAKHKASIYSNNVHPHPMPEGCESYQLRTNQLRVHKRRNDYSAGEEKLVKNKTIKFKYNFMQYVFFVKT